MKRFLLFVLLCLAFRPEMAAADNKNVTVCDCLGVRSEQHPLAPACKELAKTLTPETLESESEQCEAKEMQALAAHLEDCTKFEQEFIHAFTGQKQQRRVTGMKEGKCHYVETMPMKGKMECHYPPEKLKDIADYYRISTRFKNARIKSKTEFVDGKPVTKTRHFIDGKEVRNALQESLDNKECVVSGYGK